MLLYALIILPMIIAASLISMLIMILAILIPISALTILFIFSLCILVGLHLASWQKIECIF
nr:MAG TPA: hypothetical protein [Caudoviricetes sp.]